jgi:mono/diheme cytochrome c family protein
MMRRILLAAFAMPALAIALSCGDEGDAIVQGQSPVVAAKPAAAAADLEKGRAIYKTNCAACHGDTGKGDGPGAGVFKPPPRDHTDAAYMNTLSDKDVASIIQIGGALKGKPLMPSHPQIRGAELDALVAYVRSLSAAR